MHSTASNFVSSRNTRRPSVVAKRTWYAATQPHPTKPPAYDGQGLALDDLIDYTPELHAEAVKAVEKYRLGAVQILERMRPVIEREADLSFGEWTIGGTEPVRLRLAA